MKKTLIALALVIPLIAHADSCGFLHVMQGQLAEKTMALKNFDSSDAQYEYIKSGIKSNQELIAMYEPKCAADEAEGARVASLPGVHIGDAAKWVRTSSSWGMPDKVNSTITKYGRDEQWVYEGAGYLYFSNGKLTAIQHSN